MNQTSPQSKPPVTRKFTCPPQTRPNDATRNRRTIFNDREAYIFAWPSKGGVIILDADAIDMEFLGLDPLDPPLKRLPDQAEEDEFCKRLLLLGAKWWDSEARRRLVWSAREEIERVREFEEETEPLPTMKERRFVCVGWPSTGGLWVAEFDTHLFWIEEEDNVVPEDTARLRMARTMDERCKVLRDRFQAKFYHDPREYKGYGDLNAWEER